MRRLFFIALVSSASLVAPAIPRVALAQVSDADRAAARELFFEGVRLQTDGKFADALDRFSRAQRVFSAPTHLLHIAECQVAVGQLVEGAETYRALVRTPLAPSAPAAFTQAQQQGAAELAQVEPRIPLVKIDVAPANAQNMRVNMDGAPMNTALVGVLRPLNPGSHRVSVAAQGYDKEETSFTLKEREQKTVPIALHATSGIVYGPPTTPPPAPPPAPATAPVPPPYTTTPASPSQPSPTPAESATATPGQELSKQPATMSLLLGLTAGASFPLGTVFQTQNTDGSLTSEPMSDYASTGGAVGLDGAVRFASHWLLALGLQHARYGSGNANLAQAFRFSGTSTTSVTSNLVDLRLGYISNPLGVGFYGEIGLGYRWFQAGVTNDSTDFSMVVRGAELSLGAGIHIKAGDHIRLIPKIDFGFGSFVNRSCSGVAGCASLSDTIDNTAPHTFVFLGLAGYYNADLGRR